MGILTQRVNGDQHTSIASATVLTGLTERKMMKSCILLAIVVISLIVQAHGCGISELSKCLSTKTDCKSLLSSINCYKECGVDIPDTVNQALKEAGCGASALTNLGLPVMLLVALAAFFNK